jgi:hypothetical protein
MHIIIEGYDPVDRKLVRGELHSVDRAQTQAADLVTCVLTPAAVTAAAAADDGGGASASSRSSSSKNNDSVVIKQNPTLLRDRPGGVRVGAALWDSGYVLSALLERRVVAGDLTLRGAKVVELGAGCGLVGLVAARLGAAVMLTDRADVLVHSRGNAAKNRLLWTPPPPAPAAGGSSGSDDKLAPQQTPPPGRAGVMPLDWSAPDASAAAASVLAAMGGQVDFVLASDRCLTGGDGVCEGGGALSKHTPEHLSLDCVIPLPPLPPPSPPAQHLPRPERLRDQRARLCRGVRGALRP